MRRTRYDRTQTRTGRWWRRLLTLAAALVVFAAVLVLAAAAWLPDLAEHLAAEQFAALGLPEATLEVRHLSLNSTHVANLNLAPDGSARVDDIGVAYSLASLAEGRIDRVEVTGARITVRVTDGTIDLGALGRFQPPPASDEPARLPFGRIAVRSSQLLLIIDGREIRVPFEAVVHNLGHPRVRLDATAVVLGATARLMAEVDIAEKSLTFTLDAGEHDLGALLAVLPDGLLPLESLRAGGRVTLKARGGIGPKASRVGLDLGAQGLWFETTMNGRTLRAEGVTANLAAELDDRLLPASLSGAVQIEAARLDDLAVGPLRLEARRSGDALEIAAQARGEGWALTRLTGSAPDVFRTLALPRSAAASWELNARIPPDLVERLAALGLDVSRLGGAQMSGRVTAEGLDDPMAGLTLRVPEFQAALTEGDLALPAKGIVAGGLSATVNAPRPVVLRLKPREGGSLRWDISAPELAITLAENAVRLPGADRLGGGKAALRMACEASGHDAELSGRVTLLPDGLLRLESAAVGGMTLSTTTLKLLPDADAPAVAFKLGPEGFSGNARLTLAASEALRLVLPDKLSAGVEGLRLASAATFGTQLETAQVTWSAEAVKVEHPPSGYSVEVAAPALTAALTSAKADADAELTATVTMGRLAVRDRSSTEMLALTGEALGPIRATMNPDTLAGRAQMKCTVQAGAPLNAEVAFNLAGVLPEATASFRCRGYRLGSSDPLGAAVTRLSGVTLGGTASLEGTLRLASGRLEPRITVSLEDGSVEAKQYEARAEGIRGSITVSDLSPPATPGGQRFEIRKAALGKLELSDGVIQFRIENDPVALFVERVEWGWAGGRLYEHALRIDPAQPRVELRVFADGLQMGKLVGLALGPGNAGEGVLYGMLPVTIPLDNPANLEFKEGFLYAKPGEGWWKLGGESGAMARAVLDQSVGVAMSFQGDEVQKRAVDGIMNFRYTTLRADFIRDKGELMLRLTTSGSSLDPVLKMEYRKLVVDFPHLDRTLRQVLLIKAGVDRATERVRSRR